MKFKKKKFFKFRKRDHGRDYHVCVVIGTHTSIFPSSLLEKGSSHLASLAPSLVRQPFSLHVIVTKVGEYRVGAR